MELRDIEEIKQELERLKQLQGSAILAKAFTGSKVGYKIQGAQIALEWALKLREDLV